jgi:hypothetical protein
MRRRLAKSFAAGELIDALASVRAEFAPERNAAETLGALPRRMAAR